MLIEPVTIPMIAKGLPLLRFGVFFICDKATRPNIKAAIPGRGPRQKVPITSPTIPTNIEATAKPWLGFAALAEGGSGGCHTGDGAGRASGGTQAPGALGSGERHVGCS